MADESFVTIQQAQMGGGVMKSARIIQYMAVAAPLLIPVAQPPLVEFPAYISRQVMPAAQQQALTTTFFFTPPPPAPDLNATVFPSWFPPRWSPAGWPSYSGPVAPVPEAGRRQRIVGITIPIFEQASGSYLAVLQDDRGRIISGSALTGLRMTLYAITRQNAIAIINDRRNQNVLNVNDVTVYNDLQVTSRGVPYNLRWRIQPRDTTLYDVSLPFERHIGQLEWSWSGGRGVIEVVLVVQNLRTVH